MPTDYSRILPWVFALLIPWMLYRRFRRNFGVQRLYPTRMSVRIGFLALIAATLLPFALRSSAYLLAEVSGACIGVALALWGASRTRFLAQNGQLCYIPHTYTGIAVSLLLLGRVVYRLTQMYSTGGLVMPESGDNSMVRSPLTVGIFFVLIGYYVCYYGLVLWKSKHMTPADFETPAAPSAAEADAVARGDTTS